MPKKLGRASFLDKFQPRGVKEKDFRTARPFFRQESVIGRAKNEDNPWEERETYIDPSGVLSTEERVTVLQNEWPEKVRSTDECPLSGLSEYNDDMGDDSDGHYHEINEFEMIPNFELKRVKKPVVKPPIPPILFKLNTPTTQQRRNVKGPEVFDGYNSTCEYMDYSFKPHNPLSPAIFNTELISMNEEEENISDDEERSKCMEYREMVNIFKPLIVQNLLVQDILPSLPFLENHDDIYESMKCHSPKIAVVRLLDEISASKELGKWQKFIDALNANGYTYIVDNIRGYKFINHQYQMDYIKNLTPKIGKMIVMRELLPHLVALDLISDCDKENIEREDANRGNFAAAVLFLGRVHKKDSYWYPKLIKALEDANMDEVAADLKIPNLLKTERMKVLNAYGDSDKEYQLPPFPNGVAKDSKILTSVSEKDNQERVSASNHVTISYNSDSYLPPVPPRVPIPTQEEVMKKRKVPLPIWTNDDYEEFVKEQIKLRQEQNDDDSDDEYEEYEDHEIIPKEQDDKISAGDVYDDVALQSELHNIKPPVKFRLRERNNPVCVTQIDSLKIKELRGKIEERKTELLESHAESELLGEMSSLHDEFIESLRKVKRLKNDNTLKEKEVQALRSEDSEVIIDEERETEHYDEKTDEYYPSALAIYTDEELDIAALKSLGSTPKQTIDLREVTMLKKCSSFDNFLSMRSRLPASVIQIYSPTFKSRKSIYDLFEQDSGMGVDNATDYEFE